MLRQRVAEQPRELQKSVLLQLIRQLAQQLQGEVGFLFVLALTAMSPFDFHFFDQTFL